MSITLRYVFDEVVPEPPPEPDPSDAVTAISVHPTTDQEQQNVPVEFGLSLAPGQFASSTQRVSVRRRSDGAVFPVQETDRTLDLNGDCRWVHILAPISVLVAGPDTVLDVVFEQGTPADNIPKTVAEIIALDPELDLETTVVLHDGTIYTASLRSALESPTDWDPDKPHLNSGFIRDGRFGKTWKCSCPCTRPDGTANRKLRVFYYVTAYSFDDWATLAGANIWRDLSGGIYEKTNTGLSDYLLLELTDRLGTTAKKVVYSLKSRSLDVELRLGTGNHQVSEPVAPGTFNINDHGRFLFTPDGYIGKFVHVTDDGSQITLESSGTAKSVIAAGEATISATGFHWQAGSMKEIWYKLTGDYYPLPKYDHLKKSQLIMPWNVPVDALPPLDDTLAKCGDNPAAMRKPFLDRGIPKVGTTIWNDTSIYEPRSPCVDQEIWNLQRVDARGFVTPEAWEQIFKTDLLWQNQLNQRLINEATGTQWHYRDDPNFYISNSEGKALADSLALRIPGAMSKNISHQHFTHYVTWLLKGDWPHMEFAVNHIAYWWGELFQPSAMDQSPDKPGGGRWPLGGLNQTRSCAWGMLSLHEAAFCMPEGVPDTITPYTRQSLREWGDFDQERAKAWSIGDQANGVEPLIVSEKGHTHNNTDLKKPFLFPSGPHGGVIQINGYQSSYTRMVLGQLYRMGMLDANGIAVCRQFYRNQHGLLLDPDLLARGDVDAVRQHVTDRVTYNKDPWDNTHIKPGGPYPTFYDLYDAAKGAQNFTNYIGMEFMVAGLNVLHNFYGTPAECEEIYRAFCKIGGDNGRIYLVGGLPDLTRVGEFQHSWKEHLIDYAGV